MNTVNATSRQWDEEPSASAAPPADNQSMFQLLFELSADAIWFLDPQALVFVDCNQAAVALMRAGDKAQLLLKHPPTNGC